MTQRYASRTTVTVERSKTEVEHILRHHGADQFLHGWETGRAIIGFRLKGYPVRITLPLPVLEDFEHYTRKNGTKTRRTPQAAQSAHEQAERQAWRALVLVLKAKLEAVEAGITTIERSSWPTWCCPGTSLWARHCCPGWTMP